MIQMSNRGRIDGYDLAEKGLSAVIYYGIEIIFDVIVVLIMIKGFSMSYNFAYEVFADSSVSNTSEVTKIITVKPDTDAAEIADMLYEEGLIGNKYVFRVKVKIGEYSGKIKSGDYALKKSMTYNEIINTLCGIEEENEDGTSGSEIKVANPTQATDVSGTGDEGATASDASTE
jgi:hypothetical protein